MYLDIYVDIELLRKAIKVTQTDYRMAWHWDGAECGNILNQLLNSGQQQ